MARLRATFDAEPDSLEEAEAARQQAFQYMLFTVGSLKNAVTSKSRELWSDRYTLATSELYGLPDAEVALELIRQQERGEMEKPYGEAAAKVREYLIGKYPDVYAALDLDDTASTYPIDVVADKFDAALEVLKHKDPAWSGWSIYRDDEKGQMGVAARFKMISVGMQGVAVAPDTLQGLFSHEVLVHALRAVNDQKAGSEYENGIPGFIDSDEGLGIFVEYAITGRIPYKIYDRYIDIAYALGLVDGMQHTRDELLERVLERALERNRQADQPESLEDIQKSVYSHVNRIYRGSRGDEHIGIYTKDIAYYVGFVKIGEYITQQLESGKSIDEIMHYLLAARFDPTQESHRNYVEKHLLE